MSIIIVIIHIVVAVALILIVLLQTGKGADMGAAFGGGSSQTLFGSTGASTFLTRLTTGAAVVFMLTSLTLAYFSGQRGTGSITEQMVAPVTEETLPGEPMQAQDVTPEAAAPAEQMPAEGDVAIPDQPLQSGRIPSDAAAPAEGTGSGEAAPPVEGTTTPPEG